MDSKMRKEEDRFRIDEINVSVPWGILAAVCWGDPCSQPVLMVHGIQDNAGSFERLIPLLPNGFYYVCLELPGHGKSTRIPKGIPLSFMLFVDAIYRFVRHFSWPRFYFLGHSLGGQLGIYYSAMYPEQVIKLITLDTVPFFVNTLDEFFQFHKKRINNLINLEEKMMNSSPPNYTYEEAVEKLVRQRPTPLKKEGAGALVKRMLKEGKSGFHFSTDQRLKFGVHSFILAEQNVYCLSKIKCPVLLILTRITYNLCQVESDRYSFKPIIDKFKEMQKVTIEIVDGYHDVHNNEPEVVAPSICDFLLQKKSLL